MGNAKFFFYPEPHGNYTHPVILDLGEALGEMYSDMITEAVDAVSLTGSMSRSVGRMQEVVTIQRDRMILGEDLAYRFHAMQNHLDRGFTVSFAADADKAYCHPLRGVQNSGSTRLNCYAHPFINLVGSSVAVGIDDYAVVETSSPALIQEQVKIASNGSISNAGGNLDIDQRLCFQYDQPAYLRHYRYYPILKRPQSDLGQSIITNEGGRLFSLSIRLVVDYQALFSFHPDYQAESGISIGSQLVREVTGSGAVPAGRGGGTLDGIPRQRRTAVGGIEMPIQPQTPQTLGLGS